MEGTDTAKMDSNGKQFAESLQPLLPRPSDGSASERLTDIRNFLASLVDSSDDAILSKDMDGYVLSWNKAAERIYGYTAEEVIGKHVSIIAPQDRPDEIPNIMERLRRGERIEHYETTRVTKDGRQIFVSLAISPIKDSEGRIIAASAIARDITARIRSEEERARLFNELSRSLNQKKVLLQEVYHRVKNNLQVISSLLALRSKYVSQHPEKAKLVFSESIDRIRAMALVHEKLYQTEDLEKLEFQSYLESLMRQLIRSYSMEKSVRLNLSGDACEFNLDQAIPLGLIFNELVMNSLKHAFPSRTGNIHIHSAVNDHTVRLTYSDDGVGLPPGIDILTSDSFGFKIVRLLTKQIQATITTSTQGGASYEITVPRSAS